MNARERILSQIKANKPAPVELTAVPSFKGDDSLTTFKKNLDTISGQTIEVNSFTDIERVVNEFFPSVNAIASNIIKGTILIDESSNRATLEQVEVAVLKGEFGVVENGAIWLPESNMMNRSLPYITQYLILVLKKTDLVVNMHEAYERCHVVPYGSFIAGPSKTADIEQSLVIGAHGARALTVIVY
jgi:L-lactate dehydrogenase complex protein LldG